MGLPLASLLESFSLPSNITSSEAFPDWSPLMGTPGPFLPCLSSPVASSPPYALSWFFAPVSHGQLLAGRGLSLASPPPRYTPRAHRALCLAHGRDLINIVQGMNEGQFDLNPGQPRTPSLKVTDSPRLSAIICVTSGKLSPNLSIPSCPLVSMTSKP